MNIEEVRGQFEVEPSHLKNSALCIYLFQISTSVYMPTIAMAMPAVATFMEHTCVFATQATVEMERTALTLMSVPQTLTIATQTPHVLITLGLSLALVTQATLAMEHTAEILMSALY